MNIQNFILGIKMILYLVENIENENEIVILDICNSEEKAIELVNIYRNNFKELGRDDPNEIIGYEELIVHENTNNNVIWSYDSIAEECEDDE